MFCGCGEEIKKMSNRKKMCEKCWKKREKERWRESKRKFRNVPF